ncbi:MAG TPA: NADH-quinone oxidoreductase subunit N [Solirubrobacteraceae bacterium]|jgi:NADH-quinone oxidoreductase subunit N|nr:NADH-quinone oxidoreductase subunit N [Solirubrobacteraceae bacterium]
MTSTLILAAAHLKGPHIDWASFMPFVILGVGALVVLMIGLFGTVARTAVVPLVTVATLVASIVIEITRLDHQAAIISGALQVDGLALVLDMIFAVAAIAAVILSLRAEAPRSAGQGEYNALILFSVLGMAVLVSSQNLVTLFVGFELLSIPLYVLCASEFRREGSLESGLKYLVIGSVGSATLVYGLALVYGATGSTQFSGIATAIGGGGVAQGLLGDPMLLTGLALVIVGFAFKASVAPFHQWTPDVYEGAPTPVTAFMATATKAAALGVLLRFFDVAALPAHDTWAPALATVAAITIVVGNAGALSQSSLKRMLGYSSVGQAGYMLAGVIVATQLGVNATVLYLGLYLFMNLTAFAVIVAVQHERADGDELSGLAGLGRRNPWLAWPMSIAMLGLAGIPGTVGFIGKFQLIHALVDGGYTWLAIVLVFGSMISLGYYLRVIAALWMRDEVPAPGPGVRSALMGRGGLAPIAGGSPEADEDDGFVAAPRASSVAAAGPAPEVTAVAVLFAAASVVFGVFPSVLFDFAAHAGRALGLG